MEPNYFHGPKKSFNHSFFTIKLVIIPPNIIFNLFSHCRRWWCLFVVYIMNTKHFTDWKMFFYCKFSKNENNFLCLLHHRLCDSLIQLRLFNFSANNQLWKAKIYYIVYRTHKLYKSILNYIEPIVLNIDNLKLMKNKLYKATEENEYRGKSSFVVYRAFVCRFIFVM